MEEKPEIKLESKIDCKLSPRQAGQWGRQVQPGLSSALLGWVLGRQGRAAGAWLGFAGLGPRQVAVRAAQVWLAGRLAWLGSRLAGLARQVRQAEAVWAGHFAGLSPRQGRAGGLGRGSQGLGSDLLGWVLGRLAGFVGAGRSSRPGQSGQVGLAGRLAWLGRLSQSGQGSGVGRGSRGLGSDLLGWVLGRLAGFVGAVKQAGAGRAGGAGWVSQGRALGFAGLGPRQAAVRGRWGRQWQPGLCLALLGWVLGRWQAAGAWLGFAGLRPRQVVVRGGSAGRAEGQAASGQWGRQGQPVLGLALLGCVLGRWQARQGSQGSARLCCARVGGVGRQAGLAGQMGQGLAGQFKQAGAAGAAGAWLGFAGLGPRQAGRVGQVGLARLCWAGWGMQGEPGLDGQVEQVGVGPKLTTSYKEKQTGRDG
ncbi:hypothetical protein PPACK8108_LOCUS19421 [Phakopsora pachyrhizi]|uniref:Uncharacterized protein n=1 Tax=Phakopsora pachyrhizi TaxID=170000 RepID=A0AAV0BCQ6_PHAPC|nr:hypothetical protein PPACK8108_LOCUS19421 [Phakopsora pachyrhizi]